jgi:hypothetical protein
MARRTAHLPANQSISQGRLLPKPIDDTFEDKNWSQAFHNTVFSAYCPPSRKERKPPRFTVCDFQELPPEHGKLKYKRDKESFHGKECEEQVRDFLGKVLSSSCRTRLIFRKGKILRSESCKSSQIPPSCRESDKYRFIENPTTVAVQAAGRPCGLLSGDWLRATRWVNLPESSKFGTNGTCKPVFFSSLIPEKGCLSS